MTIKLKGEEMNEPKPPIGTLIYQGDTSPNKRCPKCGSSFKRVWLIFRSKKCIHPKCSNYYKLKEER